MKRKQFGFVACCLALGLAATLILSGMAACSSTSSTTTTTSTTTTSSVSHVFTMSNDSGGNQVLMFNVASNGNLAYQSSVATQGNGGNAGVDALTSQNSLVLSSNDQWLLAANAGSNTVTVFSVGNVLTFASQFNSGGTFPVSIAISGSTVYVLNAGGPSNTTGNTGNISGFTLSSSGQATPIANSTVSLGNGTFTQIGFDPSGSWLLVTDKLGGNIWLFSVGANGTPSTTPVSNISAGAGPFSFIFSQNYLMVAEAGDNAVSSYSISSSGTLTPVSSSVKNGQKATCWIIGANGWLYTSNPGTSSLSAFQVSSSGMVTLASGFAAASPAAIDITLNSSGKWLFALDPVAGGIAVFSVESNGNLVKVGTFAGPLGVFAQGIATTD